MFLRSGMSRAKTVLLVMLACFWLGGTTSLATADASTSQGGDKIDTEAMEILQNMARTIAGARQFSVTVRSNYDAPQDDGQMIEFGAVRKIQIERPANMRVDLMRDDGIKRVLLFNGKEFVIHNATANVYSQADYKGNLDAAIKHLVGDLKIPLPLARMFLTTLPADLDQRVQEIAYVGGDVLTPLPSHQLAIRTHDVDFQVWVAQGAKPLPQKLVITYKGADQAPQFRADFSEWDLSAKPASGLFDFEPPAGAEKIPLLVPDFNQDKVSMLEGGVR